MILEDLEYYLRDQYRLNQTSCRPEGKRKFDKICRGVIWEKCKKMRMDYEKHEEHFNGCGGVKVVSKRTIKHLRNVEMLNILYNSKYKLLLYNKI